MPEDFDLPEEEDRNGEIDGAILPGRLSRYCTVCKEAFHPFAVGEQYCGSCKREYEFYSLRGTHLAPRRLKLNHAS
jgi:hypothetical protein